MTGKAFGKILKLLKPVPVLMMGLTTVICVFGSVCYVCKASDFANADISTNGFPPRMFLILLSAYSVIATLVTEGIKRLATDRANLPYNIVALISSLIIGGIGTAVYYQLNSIPFTVNNIIYIVLMGLASGLVSMVGFDKVKQAIGQMSGKK